MTETPHTPLEACPCCAHEAKFEKQMHAFPPKHWVKCTYCGMSSDAYSSRESARAAWNKRVPATALTALTERVERLEEENARLREALGKARQPTWFYDANEPETCLYSPEEVVDFMDPKPGKHVFEVECATSLPSIWCAVEVLTDEQMDERETDDRFIIREFATEAEARAALKETASEAEPKPASCPSSPTGRCIVDSTMESGPNNCFHCERKM